MTGQHFAIFDTAIGACGVIWGERGTTGVQLPMGSRDKTCKRITSAMAILRKASRRPR